MLMQSVVETHAFLSDAKAAGMGDDERAAFVAFIAENPQAGDVMQGTGGARKVRWARRGSGKSGGYRVVTFYAGQDIPVFLLAVFAKSERANLSKAEQNALRAELTGLAADWRKGAR